MRSSKPGRSDHCPAQQLPASTCCLFEHLTRAACGAFKRCVHQQTLDTLSASCQTALRAWCGAGMAVFDTMRHIRPAVSTVCVGLAASMGAFLLASGQQARGLLNCCVLLSLLLNRLCIKGSPGRMLACSQNHRPASGSWVSAWRAEGCILRQGVWPASSLAVSQGLVCRCCRFGCVNVVIMLSKQEQSPHPV